MPLSIWDLAVEKLKEPPKRYDTEIGEEEGENKIPKEKERTKDQTYVIFCGSKDCGKSSLILRFLDRDDQPKPTVALEYTYGRRTRGNTKDVGHLWELGGGPFLANLLEIPITPATVADTAVLLMIDLSQPETLWNTLESLLGTARKAIEKSLIQLKPNDAELVKSVERDARQPFAEHADKDMLNPFPIRLAIVGGKYDIFQDFDSEKKKVLCKTLRFMAHINGASLQFFSNKIESLVSRGRALVSNLAFGTTPSKGVCVDYNKPLFIPQGTDSLQDIGAPPTEESASTPTELWKHAFCSLFPQKDTKMEIRDDPAKDPQYKEESIDRLRAQKDQELERYIRQKGEKQHQNQLIPQQKDENKDEIDM